MANNKSPGPDGYTCEFFKAAWTVVGKDLVLAIKSFFEYGFLPKGINSTILALIPKKLEAKEMKDYRPISCCNVLYKVISKLLANRMKQILPSFISSNQSAFVKNRLLMENVLLASELVKSYHSDSVSTRCAMQIDISKAFDSVQWPFILTVLQAINIPPRFVLWIKRCIEMASFSVQINGELAGYFQNARGLRQGCSLSPYLFVICMQVLSKMLDKAASTKKIGYHPYCQGISLTHLCFADDLLVFTDGKGSSIEETLKVFREFEEYSGLKISLEKSTLFLAGVEDAERGNILDTFPFASGTLPVRYLGLPLLTKRMSVTDYTPLLERIRKRITCWTARSLSFAGRLQLIGSVLHSITNFWMSAFRLPKQCITEIDRLCSSFLWSGPSLNHNKAKVAWKDVCKPKHEGGLGLVSLTEANMVSCLKMIWRIISARSSIWVRWIHRYLIRKSTFWNANAKSSLGSWTWKKLLKYRPLAATFSKVEIQSGSNSSFWFDNWCPLGKLVDLVGDSGPIAIGVKLNASVESAIQSYRPRKHRQEILKRIEEEIVTLRARGLTDIEDTQLWRKKDENFSTVFSTKITRNLIHQASPVCSWYRGLWFSFNTPKHTFITWLAMQDRLSTGNRMAKWNPQADPTCVLCNSMVETRDHIFFECSYSSALWQGLTATLIGERNSNRWNSLLLVVQDTNYDRTTSFLIRYTFQLTIYSIWRERNGRKHGQRAQVVANMSAQIDKGVRNRISTIKSMGGRGLENAMSRWTSCSMEIDFASFFKLS